jgi:hypothetical protein
MILSDCESDQQITSASSCRRTLFKISYVEDYFSVVLNPEYEFFYSFDLKPSAIYSLNAQPSWNAFFCDRISPELDNPASYCLYNPILKEMRIWTSENLSRMALERNTFKFRSAKEGAIMIQRLALNPATILTPPDFAADISSEITISEKDKIACNFVLQTF